MLCRRREAVLKIIPLNDDGTLKADTIETLISDKTGLISVSYISNVLGIKNPVKDIIKLAHSRNIPVLIDGAQAVQHIPVDVRELDCDFFVFSGHKIYAETGIGVLYGKQKWLNLMPPSRFGGGMINQVNYNKTTFGEIPFKFEAGTGNYAGAVSLEASLEYISRIGFDNIMDHESEVYNYAIERIRSFNNIIILGDAAERFGVISFNIENIHPYDAALILDKSGIQVRSGAHCAEPLMKRFGIDGAIRASFALYNTKDDVDKLIEGLEKVQKIILQ